MSFVREIDAKAIELGKHVLRMTTAAGSGHPSSALSILHIVTTLMRRVMRFDPKDPWNPGADRLVLSEGHAVPAVYAAYADLGGVVGRDRTSAKPLSLDDLRTLRELSSTLDGHPNPAEGFHFFDAATGSLGQGLSVAAGLAIAARLARTDRRVFAIIGDGESREGQIWEAADFIVDHRLASVTAVFNCNGQGQAAGVSHQQSAEALAAKMSAFGWLVRTIDGHDADQIVAALAPADRPVAVIARTVKGWGVDLLHDQSNHGKPLTEKQLAAGEAELDAMVAKLGVRSGQSDLPWPAKPASAPAVAQRASNRVPFESAMKDAGLWGAVEKNACGTRRAYGAALLALGKSDDRIIALDGDVSNSTFAEFFAKSIPQRFFEGKIAEQNIVSVAAGAAAAGYIPFVSTFAKFLARAYDQIEMAQISRANIKLVGSHSGVSLAADGPSQMSLHDIAFFRAASQADNGVGKPVCVTFHPSDAVAAYHCTWLMASHPGMCFLRTHRPDTPILYKADTEFRVGGSHLLATGDALSIVSSGYMVHVCEEVVANLAKSGIRATLVDAYSFPLDCGPILKAAAATGNRILVVEDNYVGGLADAVALAAAESGTARVHGMTCKRIPKSAKTPAEVLAYVGLSPRDIEAEAKRLIG